MMTVISWSAKVRLISFKNIPITKIFKEVLNLNHTSPHFDWIVSPSLPSQLEMRFKSSTAIVTVIK